MTKRALSTSIPCLVALLGIPAATAFAQPPAQKPGRQVVVVAEEIPTRTVSFADLDLSRTSGRRILERRVQAAVGDVCEEALGPSAIYYADQACRRTSWRDARRQLDRAYLRAAQARGPGASWVSTIIIIQASR